MTPSLIAVPLVVWERDGLKAALTRAGLPAGDMTNVPAGFGGIEVHGADALLRSVVTLPPLRKRGIARAIVNALEAEAIVMKCSAVWLLTTTSRDFFGKLGYAAVERGEVPAAIRATEQFASLCPDNATVMVKRLG